VNTIQNIKDISFNKTKMFRIYNDELRLNENFEIAEEATLTVFGRKKIKQQKKIEGLVFFL
jgi:hypothetical protein